MARCEALVLILGTHKGKNLYHPCGQEPADLHHKLTRARGGLILDEVGENYHLMYLCRKHHDYAHGQPEGIGSGLLLRGSVARENGVVIYTGPDEYLSQKYGHAERG